MILYIKCHIWNFKCYT